MNTRVKLNLMETYCKSEGSSKGKVCRLKISKSLILDALKEKIKG